MAITKTINIKRIDVIIITDSDPRVDVRKVVTFDDPSDDQLPSVHDYTTTLYKYTLTTNEEGEQVQVATDYSAEDALVRSICDAIWS